MPTSLCKKVDLNYLHTMCVSSWTGEAAILTPTQASCGNSAVGELDIQYLRISKDQFDGVGRPCALGTTWHNKLMDARIGEHITLPNRSPVGLLPISRHNICMKQHGLVHTGERYTTRAQRQFTALLQFCDHHDLDFIKHYEYPHV